MTGDRDVTRIVRGWLHEDGPDFADHLLGPVLDEVETIPQRRSWWQRFTLSTPAMPQVAVAVAVAVLALAVAFALGRNVGAPVPQPTPDPIPRPTPLSWIGAFGDDPVVGGRYLITAGQGLEVTLEVPDGWGNFEGWAVVGPEGSGRPGGVGLGFWDVRNLFNDPLDPAAGMLDPPVGPTVDDLAEAFATHPGWTAEPPLETTVDGFRAVMVEIRIPTDATFGDCRGDQFRVWMDADGGSRCAQGPGQVEHVYIVDVDGVRLVFDAVFFPATPEPIREALLAMVDSIEIAGPPGGNR